jgi:hypothetical protein
MKRMISGQLLGGLVLTLVCQRPGWPEKQPVTPPAAGTCDSPYPDAQGNVTFSCRGLTDEQIRLLPSLSTLVEKLLHAGVDGSRLESQTNNILKVLQTGPESIVKTTPSVHPSTSTLTSAPVSHPSARPPVSSPPEKEVISYDYRGYKTSSLTGPLLIQGDEGESLQYQKLLALQKAGEWKKLLHDATHEIKKAPDWLTPYAFEGVALQHLGKTQEAIAALEYVDQRSTGNSDYDQVRRLLKKLKSTP